ncbi:GntG family PLP-dependent aldolase [Chloroflexota bacterium]
MKIIELRSDTKTQPTDEMRQAMFDAEVGDDAEMEDPTVNRLEELTARMMGTESALLTSSGMMSNLIAILTHTNPGDEILLGNQAHIHVMERGAQTLGGAIMYPIPNELNGQIDLNAIENTIRRRNARYPNATLFCLENTHNSCNGSVLTPDYNTAATEIAHKHGLKVHIDGARIFNSAVALKIPVSELVSPADSICFCLSKGLSCPIGSLLCGTREFIREARRWRQILGGQMRQAGHIAAAGIVALQTMVERLSEDHATAHQLAYGLARIPGMIIQPEMVQTNILFFSPPPKVPTIDFVKDVIAKGVRINGIDKIRAVTHRMVTGDDIDEALNRIELVLKK